MLHLQLPNVQLTFLLTIQRLFESQPRSFRNTYFPMGCLFSCPSTDHKWWKVDGILPLHGRPLTFAPWKFVWSMLGSFLARLQNVLSHGQILPLMMDQIWQEAVHDAQWWHLVRLYLVFWGRTGQGSPTSTVHSWIVLQDYQRTNSRCNRTWSLASLMHHCIIDVATLKLLLKQATWWSSTLQKEYSSVGIAMSSI